MLARLGRPGLPHSVKSVAGALPVAFSPSAEPRNSSRRSRIARRQSSADIGVKAFPMRTKRCARNALYTFDTRRFNRQFTASGFQSFDHRCNLAAGFGSCVISKPFSQGIGVGNGCFSEAVSNANLGAKAFRSSFSEEQSAIGRDSYLNLSRQGGDIQRLQIGWPAWEPTVIAEEHQPRCKGESVLSALGHHHGVI